MKEGIHMLKRVAVAAMMLAVIILVSAAPVLAEPVPGETGEVVSQNVTVRTDHSTSAKTVGSLENGDTFQILDRWEQYLYIAYTNPNTLETINGWLLNYYVVENPLHITLRNSNIAALAYPSSDSKRVGSLAKYTRLTVIAQLDKYWIVSLREAAAAIPKSAKVWLDEELETWAQTASTAGTVTNRTTTRTGPGTNWSSVQTLNAGSAVEILGSDGEWYVIKYKDAIAYIKMADVNY